MLCCVRPVPVKQLGERPCGEDGMNEHAVSKAEGTLSFLG